MDKQKINTVVFDLGGVLVDWNPDYLYRSIFPNEEERKWFLSTVCTSEWNLQQDAGRSLQDATALLLQKFPEHETAIRAFYDRWTEMHGGAIEGTVEVLAHLKSNTDKKLYALTNWSAETFPVALEMYDFLHWFDGRVVSGEEKMIKPNKAIYQVLIDRYNITPSSSVYIDDMLYNVVAARELGFHGIHFQSPQQLKKELMEFGVL